MKKNDRDIFYRYRPIYKLKGAYSKDEFTDIKSFKERVNDFIELVEKDNARRIRIDFKIEWEKD